jgi:gamma-carbonic anhydrase
VMNLFDQRPRIATNAFVAPSASVIGTVELWDKVSVWYGAVVRGE